MPPLVAALLLAMISGSLLVVGQGPNVSCEDASCSECNNNPKECTKCVHDFVLSGSGCFYKEEKFCAVVEDSVCMGCRPGHVYDTNTRSCDEVGIDYCALYDRSGRCVACAENAVFGQQGRCVPFKSIDPHCGAISKTSAEEFTCIRCDVGWGFNNSVCSRMIPFCAEYNFKGQCSECCLGYYLSDNRCQKTPVMHCKNYDPVASVCEGCFDGYFLNDSRCDPLQRNCSGNCKLCDPKSLDDPGTCFVCDFGYFLTPDGTCLPCDVPNCTKCQNNVAEGVCSMCARGYKLEDNACVPCGAPCLDCFADECFECESPFVVVGGRCVECLNTQGCEATTDKDTCLACNSHCVFEDNNPKGPCLPRPSNCERWGLNNECELCVDPITYMIDPDDPSRCVPINPVEKCTQYATNGAIIKCVQCELGWFLNNSFLCQPCSDGCENIGCIGTATSCNLYSSYCSMGCALCEHSSDCLACDALWPSSEPAKQGESGGTYCTTTNCASRDGEGRCTMCWEVYEYTPFSVWYYLPKDGNCSVRAAAHSSVILAVLLILLALL